MPDPNGLDIARRDHPEDVRLAEAAAARAAAALGQPIDPAVEPWPPMRVAPR